MNLLYILLALLFRISGNGVAESSYLLATNRYVDCTFADSIPGCFRSFAQCHTVVTEFVLDSAMVADKTRHSELTLRTGFLYTAVRDSIMTYRMGYNPERSIELFFPMVASQTGIPVVGLDDLGETLYILLERNPEEYQQKMLQQLLDFPEYDVDLEREILRNYRQGSLLDISYAVSSPDNHATVGYADYQTYVRRNAVWVKRLAPLLKQGGCFICLDALYLGGEQGLIAQLQKAGYRVKKVKK